MQIGSSGLIVFTGIGHNPDFKLVPDYGVDVYFSSYAVKYNFYDDDGDAEFLVFDQRDNEVCRVALCSFPTVGQYTLDIKNVASPHVIELKKLYQGLYGVDVTGQ